MARAVALNILKASALVAVLTAAFAGLGWLIGGTTTALLFALCALLAATGVYRYGDRALLGMLGARPFALAEDPALRSLTDATAAKLGVRPPEIYVIPDGFPRLFAVRPEAVADTVRSGFLRLRPLTGVCYARPRPMDRSLNHRR